VTKGTVRVLVGLVAFPVAWIVGAVLGADDVLRGMLLFVVFAIGAAAVIVLVDRALALARAVVTWYVVRERAAAIDIARDVRAEVIDAVFALVPLNAVEEHHDRRWSDRRRRRHRREAGRVELEAAGPHERKAEEDTPAT
jgi:hypothetical protein